MGNMSGSYGSHYTLWMNITENSVNQSANTSNVTVNMYLGFDGTSYGAYTNYTTYGSMTIDGSTSNYSIGSLSYSAGSAKDILLASWTGDIAHNNDGTKTLNVSGSWNTNTDRIGSGSASASSNLTTIGRYAHLTSFTLSSRTVNSLTFSYTTDRAASLYLKMTSPLTTGWLNRGQPFASGSTSGSFTVYYEDVNNTNRLGPNKSYEFSVLVRDAVSGLDYIHYKQGGATLQIASITAYNFDLGTNPFADLSNYSGRQVAVAIFMDDGVTNLFPYTSTTSGRYTFNLTDAQITTIYKRIAALTAAGTSWNAATLEFKVRTTSNGVNFYSSSRKTCTLRGNIKTTWRNINGTWKHCKHWRNINGTWKQCVRWRNVNGVWKRCI